MTVQLYGSANLKAGFAHRRPAALPVMSSPGGKLPLKKRPVAVSSPFTGAAATASSSKSAGKKSKKQATPNRSPTVTALQLVLLFAKPCKPLDLLNEAAKVKRSMERRELNAAKAAAAEPATASIRSAPQLLLRRRFK